jgi:hypothetical protein
MKFFLPPANDAETAERSYQAIKKYNEKQTGWQISDVRYYEINYRYNDQAMRARVGELDPLEGQMVIAIFKAKYSHGPYLVCTRGVRARRQATVKGARATNDSPVDHDCSGIIPD